MDPFLKATDVIDWRDPEVLAHARALGEGLADPTMVARRCFEWVRDEIKHSSDHGLQAVTCTASEVLREGSGFCYAKSHLLAALLRANGLPAGLCYQRLTRDDEGTSWCLHGLNAVRLPGIGWIGLILAAIEPVLTRNSFPRPNVWPFRSPGLARPICRRSGLILCRL